MRWCSGNPCDGLKRPEDAAPDAEISVMSPDQLAALFAVAEDAVERRYIALSAWTGARQSEILRLQASDVHGSEGVIVLAASKTKTRQRRIVPILGKVKAHLPKSGALFPPDWKPERLWIAGRAVLGGTWPRNVLRHSQISYRLAMLKGDVNTVAMESGNSPDMIFRHYRGVRTLDGHLVTLGLAREWFK
jgi:integrase